MLPPWQIQSIPHPIPAHHHVQQMPPGVGYGNPQPGGGHFSSVPIMVPRMHEEVATPAKYIPRPSMPAQSAVPTSCSDLMSLSSLVDSELDLLQQQKKHFTRSRLPSTNPSTNTSFSLKESESIRLRAEIADEEGGRFGSPIEILGDTHPPAVSGGGGKPWMSVCMD
ncbi:hypothetical protein HDU82_008092 [Entophlyctis luteolus]|nr:hypothetical protein HDU82_008092 [Entophlyctis luteolus]